jgi:hypothetical protein
MKGGPPQSHSDWGVKFTTQLHSVARLRMWLEVFMAVTMMMAVFWVVAPCRLVWVYQRFRGLYCLHHQGEEPVINSYQSTWCYNPEDSHFED